jgi:acyl-CoA synthetase (AMP-forming)/AMP-acid ligase II
MLACLKAGTVMTPVNVRLDADDIRFILDDAWAKVLLVAAEFVPLVAGAGGGREQNAQVIVVGGPDDTYEQWLAGGARETSRGQEAGAGRGRVAARVYTSGTTSRPRAVLITEEALIAQATAVNSVVGVDSASTGMIVTPLFHISGLVWALHVVYYGARAVIVRDFQAPAFLEELVGQKVTHVLLVPPWCRALLDVPDAARRDYSHLRVLAYGAAPMPFPLLHRVLETFDAPVFQGYGMTETTSAITMLGDAEHRDQAHPHRIGSAGKPLPGVELAIVDPVTGIRCPAGQTGEVTVRTRQLMAGYGTGEAVDSSAISPDGWLRTGDAGYQDGDGYLFIVDRMEDAYRSGGQIVYPRQVENVLVDHPSVAEVAVVGKPNGNGDSSGMAFVVTAPDAHLSPETLLAHCRERLAPFQCPAYFEAIPALPRSAAGKVMKHRLREQAPAFVPRADTSAA